MLSLFIIVFNLISFALKLVNSASLIDLNGQWSLEEFNGKYTNLQATVPGGIYTDLMNNKIIDDIFYGYNDINTKWIPRLNWTYSRNFSVEDKFLECENINLIFDGLDTFSEILLNDEKVGESQNMFVQYIFDIKRQLKVGLNELIVHFRSPIEVAADLAQKHPYDIPLDCPPEAYRGECHVNMIRKMQASFSWDWGPSFPSVGIWKNVYIESYSSSVIRYLTIDTTESDDTWTVNIDTYLANNKNGTVDGNLIIKIDLDFTNLTQIHSIILQPNNYNEIVSRNSIVFPKTYVHTWWPNGYGSHDLYTVTVQYLSKDETETDSKQRRIGFKTVELVQEEISNKTSGLSFYFKINHIPIFMKGSNEIPIDILPEKGQNKTIINSLLQSAKQCNMNMIRVWGGGVYESEYFYELANELGILIWQDFMFACSLYPTDDQYLSNILEEVQHQVKRLRSFTNIIVYSGNNENEGVLANNWYNTKGNFSLYKNDYVKLYIDTIKKEFERLTYGRAIFISSSPTNGVETEQEGWVANNPGDSQYGDVHYYNYILDSWNPNIYPTPRFASEYGYQALPGVATLLQATTNISDLRINGSFLDHRQHHPLGNAEMLLLMNYQLKIPNATNDNFIRAFVYYSQIIQAMAIKIETEHYRKWKSEVNSETNEGMTMGALYWQLNDVWVAPTWSGIDYAGRWKMLQYFSENFFAPIIILGHVDATMTLRINVVSDLLTPIENAEVSLKMYQWSSFEPIGIINVNVSMDPGCSKEVYAERLEPFLAKYNCTLANCFIFLTLTVNDIAIAPDNFVLPTKLKNSNLSIPNIKIDTVKKTNAETTYEIQISSDTIAMFVWLESKTINGKFSENAFLQNVPVKKIQFVTDCNTSVEEVIKSLTVTNLLDKQIFV